MQNPKLIFFDVDNTLLDSTNHQVPKSTQDALKQLVTNGYTLFIASGRGLSNFLLTKVQEIIPWNGYILSNGAVVYDSNFNEIFHHYISDPLLTELIQVARQNHITCFFGGKQNILLDPINDYVEQAHAFFNEAIPHQGTYQGELIDKILVYGPVHYAYDEFRSIEGLSVFPSMSTYADIISEGISKYSGITELLNHKNLAIEYCAFGDAQNDIEMITHATIGIAMSNGDNLLKSQADYIADDINQDGIAKMLKQLNYI